MSTMVYAGVPPLPGEFIYSPNSVILLRTWLQNCANQFGHAGWWIATEWSKKPHQVLVSRAGGSRQNLVVDRPQMLVECYGPSQDESEDMAQEVEAWITASANANIGVYRVEWLAGPVPYPDAHGRSRVQMSFYLRVRMRAQTKE